MFDPKFIRLQELFGNLYCLEHLGGNTRRDIRELILENLPKEIKQKIPSIDFTTDPDNFIQVEVIKLPRLVEAVDFVGGISLIKIH